MLLGRRDFLAGCGLIVASALLAARRAAASPARRPVVAPSTGHPRPRPGITGAKVLAASALGARTDLVPLFDGIRAIPGIADGIRCNCGCAELPGYYSLLSCYEAPAMAMACPICQGQGRLAVRLRGEGKSLGEIRVAIDAQFG